jgi:hypothetical protein
VAVDDRAVGPRVVGVGRRIREPRRDVAVEDGEEAGNVGF